MTKFTHIKILSFDFSEEDWLVGQNLTTGQRGLVHILMITPLQSDFQENLENYEYEEMRKIPKYK